MDERAKLWLRPALGPLQSLMNKLRALPWPAPLQRLTERGIERLGARMPELLDLLGRAPAPAKPRQTAPSTASLETLLAQLGARDFRTRLKAVQALTHHPGESSTRALIAALRDRSVEVAVDAVHVLGSTAGASAHARLRDVLDNPEGYYHPLVRAAAVHALGKLGSTDSARIEQALRDGDAEVSIAAIAALSLAAPARASEALAAVIENADGFFLPITRLAAARGLARLPPLPSARNTQLSGAEGHAEVREVLTTLVSDGP
jgi:hypothetical protein